MTDLKSVRLTCKTWNALSKDSSFTTKHLARQAKLAAANDEFLLVLMMDYEILLVSVNFDENADAFMREVGALINLDGSDQIDICQVFHCNGLLLCISDDNTRLLVWNPYWGQSQWINPIHNSDRLNRYMYALGYDKSTNSHKILSFVDYTILNHFDYDAPPTAVTFAEYSIYDFNSRSWTVLDDVTLDWILDYDRHVSIEGNTYWFAKNKASREEGCCLLCFDFTREIFGAPLPLPPFVWDTKSTLALSSVRDEQVAILFQRLGTLMEIWVTTKIEPDTVLWSSKVFLDVNITNFHFPFTHASFFIDVEKKLAVVFSKDKEGSMDLIEFCNSKVIN